MDGQRSKLTVASEITNIAVPLVSGAFWLYSNFAKLEVSRAGKVNWLLVPLGILFVVNLLFSLASRRQAKSIPIKIASSFHSGKIDGGEAALFCHYSAYSDHLASRLESLWQHWYEAEEVLSRPLDKKLPVRNIMGLHSREWDIFTIVYNDHIKWMAWEIPEFRNNLPPLGSTVEYLDLVKLLKAHARLLEEGAKEINEKTTS